MRPQETEKQWLGSFGYRLQFFAGEGGEKTEEATAKRLQDARKEGQVAKSQEIITAAMLFALFAVLRVFSGFMADRLLRSFYTSYSTISVYAVEKADGNFVRALINQAMTDIVIATLPVFLIAVVLALALNVFQVRLQVTTKPLQPKFSKLDPIKGFKKIFSKDKVIELLKSLVKIGIIFYLAYSTLQEDVDKIAILYELGLMQAVSLITSIVINMGMKISAFYLVLGLADLLYQRLKFKKDMRMSKQEVKDEYKQQEGDPQVKGRIKNKMRETSMRRMMQNMPEADVVITNPTHFACAIRYDKETAAAPVLLAKGADYLAQKIKEAAKEYRIPIVENKALARMLYYNVDVESEIPAELYQMTAEVLAYVYQLKNQ